MSKQFPLTLQQQWLWKLSQTNPEWNCVVAYPFRLIGPLDIQALQGALQEVTSRHGALRTRISCVDGVGQQQIDDPGPFSLEYSAVGGQCAERIESNARRAISSLASKQFDLEAEHLLHASLLRLSAREHWLVLRVHRLAGDCYAVDVMLREVWSLYGNLAQGKASSRQIPLQYSDYVKWQADADEKSRSKHETYWTKKLAGAVGVQWPHDFSPSVGADRPLGKMSRTYSVALSCELKQFARRAHTLAPNVMLAIYVAVIRIWCKRGDFVIPFNVAGRQSEHRSVVGFFPHILYLRFVLNGSETFSELLELASNEFYQALAHQDFGRVASREPQLLNGVFFQWITWHPEAELKIPGSREQGDDSGLTVSRIVLSEFGEGLTAIPTGMVDVEVTFFDTAEGIHASGVYRSDLFSAETMDRFMSTLNAAVEYFVHNPSAAINQFDAETLVSESQNGNKNTAIRLDPDFAA